jgi:hypothetical protein
MRYLILKQKKMESSMTILFSVRQSKINRNNQLPVYMRVTIGGARFEVATGKSVSPERWSASSVKAKGATIEAREVNAFLESLAGKAYAIQRQIIQEDLLMCMEVLSGSGREKIKTSSGCCPYLKNITPRSNS